MAIWRIKIFKKRIVVFSLCCLSNIINFFVKDIILMVNYVKEIRNLNFLSKISHCAEKYLSNYQEMTSFSKLGLIVS
jgi:hypothetical protein